MIRRNPPAIRTVRDELLLLVSLREEVAARYEAMARDPALPEKVGRFLETLAAEERVLVEGIRRLAEGRDRALDAWIQFPSALPVLADRQPRRLEAVLELAVAIDEALARLCRPLSSSRSQTVRSWCQSLAESGEARSRNRARVVALESYPEALPD